MNKKAFLELDTMTIVILVFLLLVISLIILGLTTPYLNNLIDGINLRP